jgi:hypothetical protein
MKFKSGTGFTKNRLSSQFKSCLLLKEVYFFHSGVTLEHIPATLSPDGTISSAPKNFEIFGLSFATEQNPDRLVKITYSSYLIYSNEQFTNTDFIFEKYLWH